MPSARVVALKITRSFRLNRSTTPGAGALHGLSSMQTGRLGSMTTVPRSPETGAAAAKPGSSNSAAIPSSETLARSIFTP